MPAARAVAVRAHVELLAAAAERPVLDLCVAVVVLTGLLEILRSVEVP